MKTNILLITTDQQRFDTIRALGNRHIRTPHLDYLVREGIAFTSAYADCPMCIPARWTIMNGLRAASYNHAYYEDRVRMAVDSKKSLPGILSSEGYQTQAVGKMHFWPVRARYGFDNMRLLDDYYRMMRKHSECGIPANHGLGQNEIYPTQSTVDETHSLTAWIVDESINFLETRDPDYPFFLWTSFSKPHPPFDPPEPYYSMYKEKTVPGPAMGDWLHKFQDKTGHIWDNRSHKEDFITDDVRDDAMRAYYGLITQIDFNLGKLFARLQELNLWDHTLIIFTSDHGEMLGDHGGYGKGNFLEGNAHIPFIVKPVKGFAAEHLGEKYGTPVTLADIMPTVIGSAGISPEDKGIKTDGIDIFELLENKSTRKYIIGEWSTGSPRHFITNGRYKYIYHLNGGVELFFDLMEDPNENRDLTDNPEYREEFIRLKNELLCYLKSVNHKDVDGKGSFVKYKLSPLPERVRENFAGLFTSKYDLDVLH